MMCRKSCAFLLSFLFVHTVCAQTFTEAASNLGVTNVQDIDDDLANGMSFYDYNQDGWDDLTMPSGQNSVIFYQNVNGFFQQQNLLSVHPGNIRQLIWVDYNSDTHLDLFVSYYDEGVRLYENDGALNFDDVTAQVGITTAPFKSYGVSFADVDGDFDLDFYICSYTLTAGSPNPMLNLYYENDGTNNFNEKAVTLGIDNGYQPSFMPVWYDFDNDGDLDLQVINDREFTDDALYVNDGNGQFTEQAVTLGIANSAHSPMSCTIGDFNNDGYFDVFESDVANGGVENGLPTDYKLFQNNAGVSFTNVAPALGVDTSFFAWGGLWVDYDNDCFEDLYIATSEDDATGVFEKPSVFYRNMGGTDFLFANDSIQANITRSSHSPVKGDVNNDGFYDIVVLNGNYNPQNVLLNSGNTNNYIKVTPKTSISNTQAIGGRVEVFANGEHQSRMILTSDGLCAQNSQHMIFGLGSANIVDSIKVTFPSGLITTEYEVNANQSILIQEQTSQQISLGYSYVEACTGQTFNLNYPGLTNYLWSDGTTASSLTVNQSGTYSFSAENQSGDTVFFLSPITFDYEPELLITSSVVDNPCGLDGAGEIELLCTPQQIINAVSWSNGAIGQWNDNLNSGSYSYEITTNYGCTYSGMEVVETEPDITIQCITTAYSDTAFGSVDFFVWGGVGPFEYFMDSVPVGSSVSGLLPGNYTGYVVDQNGCVDSVSFVIENLSTAGISGSHMDHIGIAVNGNVVQIYDANIRADQLNVFDVSGRKVLLHAVKNQNNGLQFELLGAPGVYQIRTDRWTRIITILNH